MLEQELQHHPRVVYLVAYRLLCLVFFQVWHIWPSWILRSICIIPLFVLIFRPFEPDPIRSCYSAVFSLVIIVVCDIYCIHYEDRKGERVTS